MNKETIIKMLRNLDEENKSKIIEEATKFDLDIKEDVVPALADMFKIEGKTLSRLKRNIEFMKGDDEDES